MLKSLHIKNFRALEDFQVPVLGRVNLIVGKNNSGKSSVLEALQIYASGARLPDLVEIARQHDEAFVIKPTNDAHSDVALPFESFFSGRQFPVQDGVAIEIGAINDANLLRIEHGFYSAPHGLTKRVTKEEQQPENTYLRQALFVKGNNSERALALNPRTHDIDAQPNSVGPISYRLIPTTLLPLDSFADYWDSITLTELQDIVESGIRLIVPDLLALTFVRSDDGNGTVERRVVKVRLKEHKRPVPLKSLGEGLQRVLQLVLTMCQAQGGFLLIDEFENGLHWSVQDDVWKTLFELADKLDVQIFATTHSWDCVQSFARIASARAADEGVLFRVGKSVRARDEGKIISTVFSGPQLLTITQSDIEVR